MGLPVPKLDDTAFEQLVEEAKKRISQYAPEWTDYNVHDPGITLLELLAWLVEVQVYTLDVVTDLHRTKYLKLLGEEPRPAESLDDAFRRVLLAMQTPYRAVTLEDFEAIVKRTPGTAVSRAQAVVVQDEEQRDIVQVIVLPEYGPKATDEDKMEICKQLDDARLLTTRISIGDPSFLYVSVHAKIVPKPLVDADVLKERVTVKLQEFFDPRRGYDGSGWPFGRGVYLSEVYSLLESVEGVDCVQDLLLFGDGVAASGNLSLKKDQVTESAKHDIQIAGVREPCTRVWAEYE